MALKVTQADVWAGDLRDEPGGLAEVLGELSRGGGSLQFVIARRNDDRPGMGQVFVTPIKGKRSEAAARSAGLTKAKDIATLRIEGDDQPGLGSRITGAMADSGVNVRGVSAAVVGKKFVAYIGLDSQADAARAMRALKSFGGTRGTKPAGAKSRALRSARTVRRR